MKISILSPANMSGGVRVIGLYGELLAELGHEVSIFSTENRRPPLRAQLRSWRQNKRLIKRPVRMTSHLDTMQVRHHQLAHAGPVTDKDLPDADVVIATWWETAYWVEKLSPQKGAKVYFMQDYGAPGQELEKVVPTWSLPMKMITISQWLANLMREQGGPDDIAVVANSVDMQLFNAPARGKQSVPTVGMMYRPATTKGTDVAVAAITLAQQKIPELKVISFGGKAATQDLPLPNGTTYHQRPPDEDLPGIYAACDAWILPSRIEGFGLPILEAMACRTPVIATVAGAAPELVNPQTGALVPIDDVSAMAEAIVRITGMVEEDWRAMSVAAFNQCTNYTWGDAARAFEAELLKVR